MPPDYSGQNLQGRSFKGQDLSGANFSGTDIRGTNFTGANLRNTDFSHAIAGVERRWFINIILVIILLILSTKSKSVSVAIAASVAVVVYMTFVASRHGGATKKSIVLTVASTLTIAGLLTLVLAVFLSIIVTGSIYVSIIQTGLIPITFALVGLLYAALFGSETGIISTAKNKVEAGLIPLLIAVTDEFLKNAITTTGGTSFHNANLTNANFQRTTLKYTNFGMANVYRTKWFQAQKLDRARVARTYLQNPKIRILLTTSEVQDKNFNGLNLRGVNLCKTNLTDVSFIGADLSEANLQDADLSRAKLVQTQLDGTDFTGATLTGAYIQDWNITSNTNFNGVSCEYVYMRLPTKENPDPLRKPDNNKEVFGDGEFGDFIQPIFDTLDLYHNQNIDPRAIAIAFKQLAKNNPDAELEIVAMEKRGQDNFLIRTKTVPQADKSKLSAEYFDNYNRTKSLSEETKLLLAAKDSQIDEQRKLIQYFMTAKQGSTINYYSQSSSLSLGVDRAEINIEKAEAINVNEAQHKDLIEAAAEIQQLLKRLEESNSTKTETEKMIVVGKAVDEIEQNPTLKARAIGALKSGGKEAFKEVINHPLARILVAIIGGWEDAH